MMYSNKLAIAVKVNGKVLREFGDQVYVPFGSEYSIFVKNLNSVRALVSISIDGKDIGDGTQFVVYPNESIDIERFLPRGNKKKGNRFKFIERTSKIEDHRGVGVEDGLVRIEYQFEKVNPLITTTYRDLLSSCTVYSSDSSGSPPPQFSNNVSYTSSVADSSVLRSRSLNDAGITVEGTVSDQNFVEASYFPVEQVKHVMVLKLLGETEDNIQVSNPVTVDVKPTCKTCGRKNKSTAKFCSECGTSLQIVA